MTQPAVDGASFAVESGEIFALVGPSGCGKSTMLRMIAGFETADSGSLDLNGTDITAAPPQDRKVGIVFQDYALFPHLNAFDNVAFAIRDGDRARRHRRAAEMLDTVGLAGLGERFPDQLSGGQQQRVALARTFAGTPHFILLDEPFSNLDAALRQATRRELRTLLKRNGVGAILVTHDQEEALSFADRLAVMRDGRLVQVGTPEQVYCSPKSAFVASFIGHTNLVPATADGATAITPFGRVPLASPAHGNVVLSIRPEHLGLEPGDDGDAVIVSREFRGSGVTYWARVDTLLCRIDAPYLAPLAPRSSVRIIPKAPATVVESDICAIGEAASFA